VERCFHQLQKLQWFCSFPSLCTKQFHIWTLPYVIVF
jgi:hypothetical protein